MRLKYEFILQELDDVTMAVSSPSEPEGLNGVVRLNATGAFIFKALQKDVSFDELVDAMMAEYGIPRETAEEGAVRVLDSLDASGLLLDYV